MRNFVRSGGRLLAPILFLILFTFHAAALEPIKISKSDTALDLSRTVEMLRDKGESVQVSTAPGPDGIVRRIEVQADKNSKASGDWAAFAIANPTDQQIDRLIVAPHYRLVGSGVVWPDLGSPRIASITPSEGFALDRQPSPDADVFRITLNPNSVVTFVAELSSHNLPQLYLWAPEAYKDTVNSYTLYRGILLGISGLLALFLTILFVVKGTSLFPATAALAWAVLAYICIDFGFWNKLMEIAPGNEQIWRAGSEVALAASLVIFLFTYLNLNRWHDHFSYGAVVWVLGLIALAGVAVFDPPVASGIARISLALTVISGVVIIGYLAARGYDRAVMLIPAWLLTLIWLAGAWMAVSGHLDNDIVQPALGGGLVLIVLLIGFTVMQHAFAGGALQQGLLSDMERQALALIGSGDIVWDWDVPRDRVATAPDMTSFLGASAGTLQGPVRNWLPVMHPDERDRFRSTLDGVLENRRGRIAQMFRLRANDGHYHWYALRARPVIGSDGEVVRCVGTLINVTEQKKAEERLLHDAVHDNLTGLPNRELFLDRLTNVMHMARGENNSLHPTVFVIDIDRFKQVNDSLGMSAGDTILLTISRRIARLLQPQDTLSRLGSDQFGLLLASQSDPGRIAAFAEQLRQAGRRQVPGRRRIEDRQGAPACRWKAKLTQVARGLRAKGHGAAARRIGKRKLPGTEPAPDRLRLPVRAARGRHRLPGCRQNAGAEQQKRQQPADQACFHGVSDTGVSGPLPSNHEARLSTRSWPIASRVWTEAEPTWGSSTACSIAISSAGTRGSSSNTSRPAERIVPSCRALISACSSTTVPRPTLTRMPLGPSAFSTSALMM